MEFEIQDNSYSMTGVKNLSVPISERPFPIDFKFSGVKRDLHKTIDACTAYITTDIRVRVCVYGISELFPHLDMNMYFPCT